MSDQPKLVAEFTYDNTSGVYEGKVVGTSTRFYFGGAQDAPMPKHLANALSKMRTETMNEAKNIKRMELTARYGDDPEALREAIARYESRGGRIQTVDPKPKAQKILTPLSLEDLEM